MQNLISDEYRKLNADLHRNEPRFGTSASVVHARDIAKAAQVSGCRTLLDYGCGKGTLKDALRSLGATLEVREYDPAPILGKSMPPEPADFVACIDVMEHIEPECVENVLDHIKALTKRCALFTIALVPASKTLSDGRNAHISLHPKEWWLERLERRFIILEVHSVAMGQEVLVFVQKNP